MEYVTEITKSEYDSFMSQHQESNFLQSWQWGDLHKDLGDSVIREGVRHNNKFIAVWTGIVKEAKRGRYLEIPGGPIMDWSDSKLIECVSEIIRSTGEKHRCVFIRIRPQLLESAESNHAMAQIGARKAPMHLHAEHTNVLNISKSEEDILTDMRRQTRYEIRRSDKRDIEVEFSSPTEQDIDEFYEMQQSTAKRHGFIQSPRAFLQALRSSFGEQLVLYRASKNGVLLNLALIIHSGEEADYYEAASTVEARKEPGAYGIIWWAIVQAKKFGCSRFNFWGIAYSSNPNHRYAGVTTFKRGFGGQDVTFTPAHDIIIKPLKYPMNWTIETIRRKKRGL